jgi:hypothetical protein
MEAVKCPSTEELTNCAVVNPQDLPDSIKSVNSLFILVFFFSYVEYLK